MRWKNNVDTERMRNLTGAWIHPRAKCWRAGGTFPGSPVRTGERLRPSLVLRVDTPRLGRPTPFSCVSHSLPSLAWLFVTRRHSSGSPDRWLLAGLGPGEVLAGG